jgi:hypothetical protein
VPPYTLSEVLSFLDGLDDDERLLRSVWFAIPEQHKKNTPSFWKWWARERGDRFAAPPKPPNLAMRDRDEPAPIGAFEWGLDAAERMYEVSDSSRRFIEREEKVTQDPLDAKLRKRHDKMNGPNGQGRGWAERADRTWTTPNQIGGGIGGAMDLVSGGAVA